LSPFSATIVQNSSNLRNDWNFATPGAASGCNGLNLDCLKKRVAQQHRRPQVISSVLPGRISLPKSDPFMALAPKGAVNSCAEPIHCSLVSGCAEHRLVNVYCRESDLGA
jgi:hypothetical protein